MLSLRRITFIVSLPPPGRLFKRAQAVMLTELWWGIASYGKWGVSTERSCAGGGFAACLPSRIRQLGWSFIGSMSGINSVNLYTQVRLGCNCIGRVLRSDGATS